MQARGGEAPPRGEAGVTHEWTREQLGFNEPLLGEESFREMGPVRCKGCTRVLAPLGEVKAIALGVKPASLDAESKTALAFYVLGLEPWHLEMWKRLQGQALGSGEALELLGYTGESPRAPESREELLSLLLGEEGMRSLAASALREQEELLLEAMGLSPLQTRRVRELISSQEGYKLRSSLAERELKVGVLVEGGVERKVALRLMGTMEEFWRLAGRLPQLPRASREASLANLALGSMSFSFAQGFNRGSVRGSEEWLREATQLYQLSGAQAEELGRRVKVLSSLLEGLRDGGRENEENVPRTVAEELFGVYGPSLRTPQLLGREPSPEQLKEAFRRRLVEDFERRGRSREEAERSFLERDEQIEEDMRRESKRRKEEIVTKVLGVAPWHYAAGVALLRVRERLERRECLSRRELFLSLVDDQDLLFRVEGVLFLAGEKVDARVGEILQEELDLAGGNVLNVLMDFFQLDFDVAASLARARHTGGGLGEYFFGRPGLDVLAVSRPEGERALWEILAGPRLEENERFSVTEQLLVLIYLYLLEPRERLPDVEGFLVRSGAVPGREQARGLLKLSRRDIVQFEDIGTLLLGENEKARGYLDKRLNRSSQEALSFVLDGEFASDVFSKLLVRARSSLFVEAFRASPNILESMKRYSNSSMWELYAGLTTGGHDERTAFLILTGSPVVLAKLEAMVGGGIGFERTAELFGYSSLCCRKEFKTGFVIQRGLIHHRLAEARGESSLISLEITDPQNSAINSRKRQVPVRTIIDVRSLRRAPVMERHLLPADVELKEEQAERDIFDFDLPPLEEEEIPLEEEVEEEEMEFSDAETDDEQGFASEED